MHRFQFIINDVVQYESESDLIVVVQQRIDRFFQSHQFIFFFVQSIDAQAKHSPVGGKGERGGQKLNRLVSKIVKGEGGEKFLTFSHLAATVKALLAPLYKVEFSTI